MSDYIDKEKLREWFQEVYDNWQTSAKEADDKELKYSEADLFKKMYQAAMVVGMEIKGGRFDVVPEPN
jgi:hypothetical protein